MPGGSRSRLLRRQRQPRSRRTSIIPYGSRSAGRAERRLEHALGCGRTAGGNRSNAWNVSNGYGGSRDGGKRRVSAHRERSG